MSESQVLKRLDFPAYCVRVLDNGLVAIAGGGGTSKTGVGNSIELGLVNYSTVAMTDKSGLANNHAQFQSIHTFEPHDAVMKFISFAVDRNNNGQSMNNNANSYKAIKGYNKNKDENISSSILQEDIYDSNKSDLYIAACVHNSIEIYKVQPIIDKHSTNLTRKRTRTNSNSTQQQQTPQPVVQQNQITTPRNRKNSSRKNSLSKQNSTAEGVQSTNNMRASANLILYKSIHIEQIINENEHDLTLSESDVKTKDTDKPGLSKSLNTSKFDEETIDVLAVCQVKVTAKNNQVINNRILLCAGTSKGSICVWELIMLNRRVNSGSDGNNNSGGLGNEMPIKCMKLKVFREAHGKHEIDDLQVNNEKSHLLSIGKDNRCILWSLSPKIEKLVELNYHTFLKDSNLRMKHARFAQNGNCLYTTYIPRIRGGGRDMSSWVHRWTTQKDGGYKVVRTHRVRKTVITSVQASKDGGCLVMGDYEGQIYLFDADFNSLANFKKQHSSVVTDLAFYHDSTLAFNSNKLILSLSIDRTLQCYTYLDTNNTSLRRIGSLNTSAQSTLGGLAKLPGLLLNRLHVFSMNMFRLFIVVLAGFCLFSYFFTSFE